MTLLYIQYVCACAEGAQSELVLARNQQQQQQESESNEKVPLPGGAALSHSAQLANGSLKGGGSLSARYPAPSSEITPWYLCLCLCSSYTWLSYALGLATMRRLQGFDSNSVQHDAQPNPEPRFLRMYAFDCFRSLLCSYLLHERYGYSYMTRSMHMHMHMQMYGIRTHAAAMT